MEQTHFESQKVTVHEEVPFLSPLINELYKDTCVLEILDIFNQLTFLFISCNAASFSVR